MTRLSSRLLQISPFMLLGCYVLLIVAFESKIQMGRGLHGDKLTVHLAAQSMNKHGEFFALQWTRELTCSFLPAPARPRVICKCPQRALCGTPQLGLCSPGWPAVRRMALLLIWAVTWAAAGCNAVG